MDKILPFIASIIGFLTFSKAIIEYMKAQKWKRMEFVANQIKEFNNDIDVKKAMQMLDYTNREVELGGVEVTISNQMLESSLFPDSRGKNGDGFTHDEAHIRDIFDHFFDKLSVFNQYINSGLINLEDVSPYLIYWITILGKKDNERKPIVLIDNIWKYWKAFNYVDMISLMGKFGYKNSAV
jgi:hypothetical protein